MFVFFQLRTVKKKSTFFRDHYYLWEAMTHIRMILKHLCLRGMLGWIQSRGYNLLLLLYSMSLISPNFDVKLIIFSQFWPGPFPKIAGNSPALHNTPQYNTDNYDITWSWCGFQILWLRIKGKWRVTLKCGKDSFSRKGLLFAKRTFIFAKRTFIMAKSIYYDYFFSLML